MLKRITIAHLKTGMYVKEFCGSWLDHPFWRSHFLLSDPEDLRQIQESTVREVWIDTDKGLDVGSGEAKEEVTRIIVPPAPPVKPVTLRDEIDRATKICAKARESITSMFMEARMGQAVEVDQAAPLVNEIANSVQRNVGALVSLARLKTADNYTYMHSVAVCALMIALARQQGFNEEEVQKAGIGGLVHDLGKMKTPLAVLNKAGKLTDEEFEIMKKHPGDGY